MRKELKVIDNEISKHIKKSENQSQSSKKSNHKHNFVESIIMVVKSEYFNHHFLAFYLKCCQCEKMIYDVELERKLKEEKIENNSDYYLILEKHFTKEEFKKLCEGREVRFLTQKEYYSQVL